jgi:hypothetical protein
MSKSLIMADRAIDNYASIKNYNGWQSRPTDSVPPALAALGLSLPPSEITGGPCQGSNLQPDRYERQHIDRPRQFRSAFVRLSRLAHFAD